MNIMDLFQFSTSLWIMSTYILNIEIPAKEN